MLTLACKRCGATMQVAEARDPICTPCRAAELAEGLSADLWRAADPLILANDIVGGMDLIAKLSGLSFGDSQDVFYSRYRLLRETRSADFACDHNAYWTGFYS